MLIFQNKSTLWMECLKLVNMLKSTFLGSEFHTECLVIKMKKNSAPVPIFLPDCNRKHRNFFKGLNYTVINSLSSNHTRSQRLP